MKASDLKSGAVVEIDGRCIFIREVQVQSPSSRSGNTLYKARGRDLRSKQKFERSFKGDENVEPVDFERRPVQFLYQDDISFTFMDMETYEQHAIDRNTLEDEMQYITDGIEGLYAMIVDGQLLGVELPATVIMEITDTSPAIKGASASARTKPATLTTGLIVQVPEYLPPGERIKVNTVTGEFISRA